MKWIKTGVWFFSLLGALIILGAFCIGKWKAYSPELPRMPGVIPQVEAKVAIVVDDLGYNLKYIDELFGLRCPLNLGILPRLSYSSRIARSAKNEGCEILLHLPLEPYSESQNPGPGAIYTMMVPEMVSKILREDLGSVPYVSGISNHMGSAATEDERLMELIFSQIKQLDLYFLDSLVTNRSICRKVASRVGIRFIQRDVFLDNKDDPDYIKDQIRKLVGISRKNGKVVGICHLKSNTLEVLKEMIPRLEEEGIKFVYLSELIE